MAISSTALLVAGVAMTAVSAVGAGVAAKNQADFQAADDRQRADREREIAEQNEEDFRRKQDRLFGTARANKGRSGVDQSTGSPLLAASDFAAEEELQALRILSGGEVSATRLEDQARLTKTAGKNARTRGFFRAGASLLSGAGKAFS